MQLRFAFAARWLRRTVRACAAAVLAAAAAVTAFPAPAAHAQQPPPCPAGTEQAVEFDGLPTRTVYGPPRIFSLIETFADYELDGPIHVTMADAATGRVFFAGDVDAYEELYVQLDLDDDPVTVTAAYDQINALAPEAGACRQTLARTVRGYRRILLPRQCLAGSYRPRTVIIACGDGNYQLRRLRWRGWNRAAAKARGYAWVNDCLPYCAAGTFHRYRVRVRAFRIRRCSHDDDRYRYTRLRITYPAAGWPAPPVARRSRSRVLACREGSVAPRPARLAHGHERAPATTRRDVAQVAALIRLDPGGVRARPELRDGTARPHRPRVPSACTPTPCASAKRSARG